MTKLNVSVSPVLALRLPPPVSYQIHDPNDYEGYEGQNSSECVKVTWRKVFVVRNVLGSAVAGYIDVHAHHTLAGYQDGLRCEIRVNGCPILTNTELNGEASDSDTRQLQNSQISTSFSVRE